MIDSELKIKSSPQQIDFKPRNETEEKHLESLNSLLEQKRYGDWELIAEMLGLETKNVEMAFKRVYSKHHADVVTSLKKIIENRQNLLNNL